MNQLHHVSCQICQWPLADQDGQGTNHQLNTWHRCSFAEVYAGLFFYCLLMIGIFLASWLVVCMNWFLHLQRMPWSLDRFGLFFGLDPPVRPFQWSVDRWISMTQGACTKLCSCRVWSGCIHLCASTLRVILVPRWSKVFQFKQLTCWSNYSDLTRVFTPKGSWGREFPFISRKSRLVKCYYIYIYIYNLARTWYCPDIGTLWVRSEGIWGPRFMIMNITIFLLLMSLQLCSFWMKLLNFIEDIVLFSQDCCFILVHDSINFAVIPILPQAVKVQQRFGAQQRAPLSVFLSKSGNCGFLIWPFFVSRPLPRIVLIFTTSSGRPYLGRSSPGGCYLGTIGEFFLSASRHAPSKILERTLQLLTITDTPVKMEVWKMCFPFLMGDFQVTCSIFGEYAWLLVKLKRLCWWVLILHCHGCIRWIHGRFTVKWSRRHATENRKR